MDRKEDFYMVLPSNSSMNFFPENSTSCFTTNLPREIRLSGEWKVGLAEIHVPCTMMHIQKSEARFEFNFSNGEYTAVAFSDFPYGIYESIAQLTEIINNTENFRDHLVIEPSKYRKGFFTLRKICECTESHSVMFSDKIRRIFGFEDSEHRESGKITILNNAEKRSAEASRPASIARAIPDQLFIYTDVCAPYTVGDTATSLLRIISLDYSKFKYGSNAVAHFAPIHYVPLLQHTFNTITIDIRDQHGERIPFEFGTLTATLHFSRGK